MILRVAHIILAFLLFISSAGLIINKHYCRYELKSVALFIEAEGCHQVTTTICPMHADVRGGDHPNKKGCCDDESEYVKTDEDQWAPPFDNDIQIHPVTSGPAWISIHPELIDTDPQTVHYLNYKPPLIVCDLPVRLQALLC